ncbi:hypothetical protein B0H14DRAFT_2590016 [Mycena olivaceomarginata]|nr:hypothetical protein B0H14DRAFT_2590016 [Mycena olivaceomarginata]
MSGRTKATPKTAPKAARLAHQRAPSEKAKAKAKKKGKKTKKGKDDESSKDCVDDDADTRIGLKIGAVKADPILHRFCPVNRSRIDIRIGRESAKPAGAVGLGRGCRGSPHLFPTAPVAAVFSVRFLCAFDGYHEAVCQPAASPPRLTSCILIVDPVASAYSTSFSIVPTPLDWDRDPRLCDLSRALIVLGWAKVQWDVRAFFVPSSVSDEDVAFFGWAYVVGSSTTRISGRRPSRGRGQMQDAGMEDAASCDRSDGWRCIFSLRDHHRQPAHRAYHLFTRIRPHRLLFTFDKPCPPSLRLFPGLSKPQLISAAATFHFDATGTFDALRARLEAYMTANKAAIMANPDQAPLFTRREREEWAARSESPDPPSWHGIGSGGRPTPSFQSDHNGYTPNNTPPPGPEPLRQYDDRQRPPFSPAAAGWCSIG